MAKAEQDRYEYDLAYDEAEDAKFFLVLRRRQGSTDAWQVAFVSENEKLVGELLRDLRSGSRRAELDDGKELRQNVTELPLKR